MSKTAYNYAIFILSKRDYSIHKMREKLTARKYEEEEINQTIDTLIEKNFLREEEYKRLRIKSLLMKNFSNSYIIRKMEQEHLSTSDDEINLVRQEQVISEENSLNGLIEKKLRGKIIPQDFEAKMKLKNKLMNFLGSKGYSYQEAKEAISQKLN